MTKSNVELQQGCLNDHLAFFRTHGYCLVPDSLSPTEVAELNHAIDRDRALYPQLWADRGEAGRFQSVSVLLSSRAFDATIRHPGVFPLVEALMGDELCFEELSVMVRESLAVEPPAAGWHRDTEHWPEHPLAIRTLSLVYYLTDVDSESHCLAVMPEAVEAKRVESPPPDPAQGVELHGKAGTAILFNAGSGHAGVVKRTPRERRTIHVYYGHCSLPFLSNHTIVPRRLLEGDDVLFGRPNLSTQLALANF